MTTEAEAKNNNITTQEITDYISSILTAGISQNSHSTWIERGYYWGIKTSTGRLITSNGSAVLFDTRENAREWLHHSFYKNLKARNLRPKIIKVQLEYKALEQK